MGEQSKEFSHFNRKGEVRMVDIGNKPVSTRVAVAEGNIHMQAETLRRIVDGGHKKGDVLGIARTAGIMAAKRTADLIPLCHPLSLTRVDIEFLPDTKRHCVRCRCHVETTGRTGVEMEALTAVQISLLTIYDMCKAVDRGMLLSDIRLMEKHGGCSGSWVRE